MANIPTVWYNKNFSPTIHHIRALTGHVRTIASHTDRDTATLFAADYGFLEPKGLVGDEYVAYCLETCIELGVDVFVPGKEPSVLARSQARFANNNIRLLHVADADTLKLLEDKARFTASFPRHICAVPETQAVRT
jgi:hypothetical protein